ncbi:MAG: TRAP transporter small permease [Pseudomonadota bacterium]|nr:TRAP transporter small permease [Pseudomonadota bacterium]
MQAAIKAYMRYVYLINRTVGRLTMYLIFVMMGILLFSTISRTVFDVPHVWVIEMAQFTMAAYYLLGGGYTMQLGAHVRMDVLYDKWTPKRRAFTDSITAFCLIFYLVVLLYGGLSSTEYALEYGQKNYSAWAPPMAPIKIIMTIGIFLMLLQAIAIFFKDLAAVREKRLP